MKWKHKVKKLEAANAPQMMEISRFRCLIDGKEEIMTALEYAYATAAEGRNGEILGKAPSIFQPVNPHPDYTALNEAFEGLKLEAVQAEIKERMEKEQV